VEFTTYPKLSGSVSFGESRVLLGHGGEEEKGRLTGGDRLAATQGAGREGA
jgi:hypothetical protein